jgi:glycosyltransferase involved in cell wall biosynthesis
MTFSLLVPSYNRPEFIRETVQSLLENSAPDVEIIVSDDVSPRRTEIRSVLAEFVDAGKIKYVEQDANLGLSNHCNALVEIAKGDYVVLIGDDDRLKPGAIDRLRKWTVKYPKVSLFGFGYDNIDEDGMRVLTFCTPRSVLYKISENNRWKEIFAFDAVPMCSHHPFTMCIKRKVAAEIRYKSTVDIAIDLLFLYESLEQGNEFLAIPEVLFEWRKATDPGGDYATQSGSRERCYRARGLLLAELLNRRGTRKEVVLLLMDTRFLARFCMFTASDAKELRHLLAIKPADGEALGDFICSRTVMARLPLARKIEKHYRAVRVMGLKHMWNFFRNKWDARRATAQLRKRGRDLQYCVFL